jgi:hypothetical protein
MRERLVRLLLFGARIFAVAAARIISPSREIVVEPSRPRRPDPAPAFYCLLGLDEPVRGWPTLDGCGVVPAPDPLPDPEVADA